MAVLMKSPRALCPSLRAARVYTQEASRLGRGLARRLRRLKIELAACACCPQLDACTGLSDLNAQLNVTIAEVLGEWRSETEVEARQVFKTGGASRLILKRRALR